MYLQTAFLSVVVVCIFRKNGRRKKIQKKQADRERQKQTKRKQAQEHKNNDTTTTTRDDNKKKRHAHIKDAGEVESNNWAVKPPQVWSLRSEPSKVTPALVWKKENAPRAAFFLHYNNPKPF